MIKITKDHPIYWDLKQFDHTGSLSTSWPYMKSKWKKLFERGLIQKPTRHLGQFEISQKGRNALNAAEIDRTLANAPKGE